MTDAPLPPHACPVAGIVLTAMFLCASPVHAQTPAVGADAGDIPGQWRIVGTRGGAVGWDASTLERDRTADSAYVTAFFYFARPQSRDGVTWSATVDDIAFQCRDSLWTAYGIFALDEDATIVDEGRMREEWATVQAETPVSALKRVACDGLEPPEARSAFDLASAIETAQSLAQPLAPSLAQPPARPAP
jgi:hypothetical protein